MSGEEKTVEERITELSRNQAELLKMVERVRDELLRQNREILDLWRRLP